MKFFKGNNLGEKKRAGSRGRKKNELRVLRLASDSASFRYIEAYKSLRTNIDFIAGARGYKSVLLTSAMPREGKSSVAINLAYTMASSGKKIILVDCDLRKGTLASYVGVSRRAKGLSSVLAGAKNYSKVVIRRQSLQFDFLPAGILPANPSEIISSAAMEELIHRLEEDYDFVIIDTPPATLVTDAVILSRMVDGVILVARADMTTKPALSLCQKNLKDVHANILGVVLNDYNVVSRSYGGYGYDYYGDYGYGAD